MAQFRFMEIELMGERVVRRKLLRGAQAALSMRPALIEVRTDMQRAIRMNFQSQGRRGGGSWKQLDPKTVESKERAGLDPRILMARHRLIDSFTRRSSRYMRTRIANDRVELESTLPYAAVQQYGSDDGHVPARPFVRFTEYDRTRWATICRNHLIGAMRGSS